ncbi:hypothetical protein [Aquimarina sp. 2201CG14-23]|uniref:hypothetical protein n=1 Tax=Aquimarina mycalae TaxID=3040073 RepID=UPI002477E226|nr:hypothetical protein [Aquimarina sp. 2201CG14-23]MDH7445863.1 hypothetical protein [Aquimarina sp. 2201CG14-23]
MVHSQESKENWSRLHKLGFRAIFTYLILYILLLFTSLFLETPLRWFAEYILHWGADFDMKSTGSGDRTFDFVRLGFNVVLTIFVVLIWTALDRKRTSYTILWHWFQAILKTALFLAMLLYGFAKVFKAQFGDPSLELLLQEVGEMSPMGLAWTFMGHSFAYSFFTGFAELLGGVLLLFRKTVTLGSLIILGVMTNVVMINFTYDVPVKQFSFHLLLVALILIWVDRNRLINVFFKNKVAEKVDHYVLIKNPGYRKVKMIGKKLIVIVVFGICAFQAIIQFDIREQTKERSEFYGIWESHLFIKNRDTLQPLLTDQSQWRYLIIDQKKQAIVKKMNDSIDRYTFETNTNSQEIAFKESTACIPQHFSYYFNGKELLQLRGKLDGDSLFIHFKRKSETDFRLTNRDFHWVNEHPFNH